MNNNSTFFNFDTIKSVGDGILLGVPDAQSLTSCTTGILLGIPYAPSLTFGTIE